MTANQTIPTDPAAVPADAAPPAPTIPAAEAAAAFAETPAAPPRRRRRGLVVGGIATAAVLALGLAFGGGVATGWAAATAQTSQVQPGQFPGGGEGGPGFGQGGEAPEQGTVPTRPDEDSSSGTDEGDAS